MSGLPAAKVGEPINLVVKSGVYTGIYKDACPGWVLIEDPKWVIGGEHPEVGKALQAKQIWVNINEVQAVWY
ncbi:MAG: hypothetical protein L3J82_08065 [Planctomycetes bacterium]|nr:hypothetical protein [Planctomycetota bacterium]